MTSIRAPVRARSGTMVSPGSVPSYSNYPTSPTLPAGTLAPTRAIPIPSATSPTNSFTSKLKPRRPSLPNMSASTSSIPTQKSIISHSTHLLPSKEPSTLRSPKSLPRLSADGGRPPSQIARPSTSLSRPSSAVSSPRPHTSPRMGSIGRFSDASTTPSQATCIPSLTATATAIATATSTTSTSSAKPAPKSQKSTGIKPPSIVTKPSSLNSSNSGNTGGSQKNNNIVSINSSSSSTSTSSSSSSSLPPIAPSPLLPPSSSCLQTPQIGGPGLMPVSISNPPTKSTMPSQASHATPSTEQNKQNANTVARSKNRLHAGIDSACFMTRSGSSESASSSPSPPSSATSTPTLAMSATMAPGMAPRTPPKHSPTLTPDSTSTGPKSPTSVHRPPNNAEMTNPSRPRAGSISVLGASILKKPTLSMSTMEVSSKCGATSPTTLTVTTPTTPSPLRTTLSTEFLQDSKRIGATPKSEVTTLPCQCPPPLEFPENVKREMKREEEEHRQRECGLYAKIIELQIEVANLKGEKESLTRVVSRRDKMLLELQVQLQAMEFVCRENEIKVDIDMCPDEAIENWSFKESDEVYQRIILTTQELLRNGARCLEEGVTARTQSRPRTRITSSSSIVDHRTKNVAGLSVNAQPYPVQDQNVDPLLFKKTSRPGTLKFDMQTLLRSEQEFHDSQSKTPKTLDLAQVNLAVERGPRRALDIGDDRSEIFRNTAAREDDDDDDDDDEGQESEFEELGEDMIKYVDLQSSMTPRQSRSSSFSKPNMPSLTPDMSTAVLMKNMWGSRRNTRTTPILHPTHGHFSPTSQSRSRLSHRGSSSSSLSSSSNSFLEDYYYRPCEQPPANVGLGLSMGSPVHPHFHHLMSAPPMGAIPPPSPHVPMSRYPMSSPAYSYTGSYYDHPGPPMMIRSATSQGGPTTVLPPPMMPLPPLPADRPRYSYRDHTKSKLLESRRPTHGRTCSHGFAIENVGQFLKRKTYGKTLAREIIYRGHRRRDSV